MEQVAIMQNPQDRIFKLLFEEDEISWQTIIYELIQSEQMDPWDIDISLLAEKFLVMLKKLKEMDFRISGKVVYAAALLLKIKSNKLVEEDIVALDALIAGTNDASLYDELIPEQSATDSLENKPQLFPRTPQPRKRKVSVYDLVKALEKALEVESRRKKFVVTNPVVMVPDKKTDIGESMKTIYQRIMSHFKNPKKKNVKLTFNQLIPSEKKEDKVLTFIPLLHLDTQRKIDLLQEQHFGTIEIALADISRPTS
jgi:segregation and condensation protein A